MVGGPTSGIFAPLLLGPLIALPGRRKMGLNMGWKPFKQEDVAFLKELIEAGKIKPAIDRTYSLADVPEALRYLEAGHARGKVVITLDETPA